MFAKSNKPQNSKSVRPIWDGIIDIIPLSIAVIPWGILCGSLAIEVGLNGVEAMMMSLLVFAGAAQLGGLVLIGQAAPMGSILGSTFVISARHLLYSASYREIIKCLPRRQKAVFAFLLTDEMFALSETYRVKMGTFSFAYAIASGVTFYLAWNLATLAGVLLGQKLPDLHSLGLEFAIAATFIAMVVPNLKQPPMVVAAMLSFALSGYFHWIQLPHALVVATLIAMSVGFWLKRREVIQ